MPLDSVDYRVHCGRNEYLKAKNNRFPVTQDILNNVAKSQQHKLPEQCSALSVLYLSSLILPNIVLVSHHRPDADKSPAIDNKQQEVSSTRPNLLSLPLHIEKISSPAPPPKAPPAAPRRHARIMAIPMAQAATLPQLDVIERNDEEGLLTATGDDGKRLLLSLAKSFFVNMGGISQSRINDMEFLWQQASAGAPITLAHAVIEPPFHRHKRISIANRNQQIADHIREHCAFETEIYHPDGTKEGEILIFKAQRIDNPFRMLYDNIPGHDPAKSVVYSSKVGNFFLDIITLGFKPLFSGLWANHYRKQHYSQIGDKICHDRQNHINLANIATALDVGGIKFLTTKRLPLFKPVELANIIPFQDSAAYIARNKETNVQNSVWMTAKPKGASPTNEQIILTPKGDNDFETVPSSPESIAKEKKRVTYNSVEQVWHFADESNTPSLELNLEAGDNFIILYGEKYRLQLDSNHQFEITAKDSTGAEQRHPVYQDPLSARWHLTNVNGHPTYSSNEQLLIEHIRLDVIPELRYDEVDALDQGLYKGGKIFEVRNIHDNLLTSSPLYTVVEMNAAIVPVRTAVMQGHDVHYSIYDIKSPLRSGHRIEWNGDTWRMEQWSSPHVSAELSERITPNMFVPGISERRLSSADQKGIRWDGDKGYLRVRGKYVEVHHGKTLKVGPEFGRQYSIHYQGEKFYPLTPDEIRSRSTSVTSEDIYDKLKELSREHLRDTNQIKEIKQALNSLTVKSSTSETKNELVNDNQNLTQAENMPFTLHKTTVHVLSIPSSELNNKRFLVTLGDHDHFFLDISRDGKDIRVLLEEDDMIAMKKYRKALSGGDIQIVAAVRRDEDVPILQANSRAEIDTIARKRIELGAELIRDVLDKVSGNAPNAKSLIVGDANFFKTAEFENNVFSSPDSAYEAMIDMLIPLSRQYPEAIIIPGAIYVSQDIPQYLRYNALRYQEGNINRDVDSFINFSTVMVPVLHKGRFVAMPRKGEFLHYKKKNSSPTLPAISLQELDDIPWGATMFANAAKNDLHIDHTDHDGVKTGTIFFGKTLFPGERAKADWFFCPCPETNGTSQIENFFSNEFIIGDDKFLLVIEDEFIQSGTTRPIVRTRAYPQEEDASDASRYDWIIHCAAGDSLDDVMQLAGYNYLEANTLGGGEYQSMIRRRMHLVSYSPEKKLTLYEFIKE